MMKHLAAWWSSLARRSNAYRVALIYLVVSAAWITTSDRLVHLLIHDPAIQTTVETLKGWGFVAVTTLLLFALIRRRADAVQDNEERLRLALMAANQGLYDLNVQTGEAQVNAEYATMLGYDPATFHETNARWIERLHPDDRERTAAAYQAYVQGETSTYQVEFRQRTRQGDWKWILSLGKIVARDGQGRPLRMLGTHTDITDRKQAEEALRDSEARFRSYIEYAPLGVFVLDATGRIVEANSAGTRLLGYSAAAIKELTFSEIIAPQSYEAGRRFFQALVRLGSVSGELALHRKDDSPGWAVVSAVKLAGDGFMAYVLDITERKRAQAQIESLARFPDENPNPVLRVTPAGVVDYANAASAALLRDWRCAVGQALPDDWQTLIQETLDFGQAREKEVLVGERSFSLILAPIVTSGYVNIYGRDITERKRAEEALQASESRYRQLVQDANSAILRWRSDGTILFFNEYAQELFGYSASEIIGKHVGILVPDQESTGGDLTSLVEDIVAHPEQFINNINENICRDGRRVWMTWTNRPIRDEQGQVVEILAVGSDISERIRAESQRETALAALRENEAFVRTVLDNLPIGIAVNSVAPDVTFTYMNDNFPRFYRTTREALVDPDAFWSAVYQDPVFREKIKRRVLADTASGEPDRMVWVDVPITRAGEETTFITARNIPLSDQSLVISTVWDVTVRKQAEDTAMRLKRQLELILNSAGEGIFGEDAAGRITFVNSAAAQMLGRDVAELYGQIAHDVCHHARPDGRPYPHEECPIYQSFLNGVRRRVDDEVFWRKDGTCFPVEYTSTPIVEDDQIVGAVVVVKDITERKRAEEEILQLNASLERRVAERTAELHDLYHNAPCGYHSLDGDGVFVRINNTELTWLGYERDEIIGRLRFPDLLTPASVETFQANFPLFKERGWVNDLEFDMVRKNGHILPVLLSATAIYDEAGRYVMSRSTIIDHTDRKRAEAQRQAAWEALQQSQARLEAVNRELEAFAYSISHDLRAPLRAIDGFSRIILEDYAVHLDDEGRRLFDVVRANTQKMDQLITDLLALSRVSRSQLTVQHFDMTVLVHDVYGAIASPDDGRNCTLTVEPLLEACGDPALLRQVWTNLLVNALKYTRPKAERRIEVGSYAQEQTHVYYVKDNGVGFNPAYAHKLFGIFQRLHSTAEFEGTGVGLAIVQRIVQRHGGQVWAEGQPDRGATFFFSLPCPEANHEQ